MNIYLDINGVVLTKDLKPAKGLKEFLEYLVDNFEVYWLTTHCKGDTDHLIGYLKMYLSQDIIELVGRVKPTNWDVLKTEGIDFRHDFRWFDDQILESEKRVLESHNSANKHILINLDQNPNQLELLRMAK